MLPRKIWHASGALIVVIYDRFDVSRTAMASVLLALTAALLLLDLARSRLPALQDLFRRSTRLILDEKDLKGLNGSTLYFGGCAFAATLFAQPVACAGILALTLGDPAAAIVGSNVRSPRWGRVSLAGSATCFVVATLAARIYCPWEVALGAGAAATLLEALSGSKLDNFTIPVGTALVVWALGGGA